MAGPLVRRAWRGTAAVVSAMTWGIESPAASSRAGVEPSCRRTGGQEAGSRERGILGDSCDYARITGKPEVMPVAWVLERFTLLRCPLSRLRDGPSRSLPADRCIRGNEGR